MIANDPEVPPVFTRRGDVLTGPGWEILVDDWITGLQQLPADSVNEVVTSVPYWALRDYGVEGQLGLEPTPELWVKALVRGFREVWRVLHPSGVIFVNCGDAYAQGGRGNTGHVTLDGSRRNLTASRAALLAMGASGRRAPLGYKEKDMLMLPEMLAEGLRKDGWYLRSRVTWGKKNAMPESVQDRPTKATEAVWMLTKRPRYFFDMEAIREAYEPTSLARRMYGDKSGNVGDRRGSHQPGASPQQASEAIAYPPNPAGRSRRDLILEEGAADPETFDELIERAIDFALTQMGLTDLVVTSTARFAGDHTATYPEELIEPLILAGTSAKGVCPLCRSPWKRIISKGRPDLAHQIACGSDAAGGYEGEAQKDYAAAGAQNASAVKARILAGMRERRTVGWVPTCGCSPLRGMFVEFLRSGRIDFPTGDTLDILKRLLYIGEEQRRDVACADPTCSHPLSTHGRSMDACGRCRCSCFRWGDPYEPVPAVVLDPFSGMHTTGRVSTRLGRHYRGIELNPKYAADGARLLRESQIARDFSALGDRPLSATEKVAAASQLKLFGEG